MALFDFGGAIDMPSRPESVAHLIQQLARVVFAPIFETGGSQIAAYADTHLRISKGIRGERTVTEIARLDADARLSELALMLGGAGSDDGARAAAMELVARAERARSDASAVGA